MATIPPLSLTDLVDITVSVAPQAASANPLNQGLFIGNSGVIPTVGSNSRLRQYSVGSFATAMTADGFTTSDPEYIAAQIYFSQTPSPSFIWIGAQNPSALQSVNVASGGSNYSVGDLVTVIQSGASNGVLQVTSVSAGVVTGLTTLIGQQGTGYTPASGLNTTTTGLGAGLTVNITAVGETLLQASMACRNANTTWYGLAVYNPTDSDNLAISEWADPLWQTTRYYPWSASTAIAAGTAGNLALQLQGQALRVLGIYSTTQSGLAPNNIYAGVAVMGVDMGSNTGLAGSFFTLAHKELAGIVPEPLTQTQFSTIQTQNFNAYCNFGQYQLLEPGFMSNGAPSYLWMFLATLVANLQINTVNVLASNQAVPQTNSGQSLLLNACTLACQLLSQIGFISGGTWEGQTIPIPSSNNPALSNGQSLPTGFIVFSAPYSQQSPADRAAGKAMPIYVCIITAGAVQSLSIAVYTQL